MSLIKSFNISYFKENLKKSIGIILLLIILVPLFTALYTIVNVNGTESSINVPEKDWLSTINMYGMYTIPVLLSFLLFGYVYKKNSVDLINSMPINRKSIFVTNTVVGIIIITIIQVLTAVALLVCNHYLEFVHIYTGVIIDLFIVMWVAYVFMFAATNLAMTMSGTFATQVLLTAIIVLLAPFIIDSFNDFSSLKEYRFIVGNSEFTENVEKEATFTLPYKNLKTLNGAYEYEYAYMSYNLYNTVSITRMLVLSAIYMLVGTYLFKKRKMENCEESFEKVRTHIFVKALTILPMIILLNTYNNYSEYAESTTGNSTILFNLCLIIFYYYIYDFIVKRKVGVKTSIAGLAITLIVLQGTCMGMNYLKENKETPTIRIEDVAEIAVGTEDYYSPGYSFDILNIASGPKHFIQNNELATTVLKGAAKIQEQQTKYEEEAILYNNNEIEYMTNYVDNIRTINVILKLNNGKEYNLVYLPISEMDYDKVVNILQNDETYMNMVRAELEKDDLILLDSRLCSQELQDKLKNEIKNKINTISKETMFLSGSYGQIIKYYYDDHTLVGKNTCIEMTPEMLNLCAKEINKNSLKELKNTIEKNQFKSFSINLMDESMWYGVSHKYLGFQKTKEDVANLLMEEETFDANKSFYKIETELENGNHVSFFTNKVDEIDNLIQLEIEKNPEYYWEYEYELQKYYRSDLLYQNYYYEEENVEEIPYEEDFSEEIYTEEDTYEGNYITDNTIYVDDGNYVVDNTIYSGEEDYIVDNTIYIEENYVIDNAVNMDGEIYIDVNNTVTNEVIYENVV